MDAIKNFYNTYLRRWVKAIASAVGGALAGLLINWVQGTTPIPSTGQEWITLLVATIAPAVLAVISPANKITQKQLDKDPNVVGGVVVEASAGKVKPSAGRVEAPPPGRKSSWL